MKSPVDDRPTKRRKIEDLDSPRSSEATGNTSRDEREEDQPARRYHRANWATAVCARPARIFPVKSESASLPPLPVPPWGTENHDEPLTARVRTSCRIRADVAVPNVPDSLQQPSKTPLLEPKRPIDYFPWTGKHPEDVINQSNVEKGYWDRAPQPIERELNTAKTPLYNAFKLRGGLESLSALFSLVLEQKSKQGALSTSSTFRPPPRVTLTEAKRKSWIADLADENVPLRRLSRTIPQGVRGAALLEQCLVHNVPTNRAIWFVKCVGANEIRTLKRKGANPTVVVGAEYKWLRDWTTNIEQFLEAAVGKCGSQNWLQNLRYCLHLCSRLYYENLLDKDHFLDWIVKSFSSASLELLAVWLSLVQMWRVDLIRFRKRAKSLAATLLTKFEDLASFGTANALQERLRKAIQGLAVFRPACFLMPDRWNEHRETVQSCLDLANEREAQVFDHLNYRNSRMLGKDLQSKEPDAAARNVFKLLDNSSAPFDINQISQVLVDLCSDHSELSNLCLQWATSRFRGGVSRTYLVARLLRRWLRHGFDIGNRILNFFSCGHKSPLVDSDSYRHLFAELSRSQSFSSSRFLQNLMLRGVRAGGPPSDQDGSRTGLEGHLLQDLSLQDAEEHLVNLKNHLLRSNGTSSPYSEEDVQMVKDVLKQALKDAEGAAGTPTTAHIQLLTSKQFDWSARFDISQWLRGEAGHLVEVTTIEVPGKPPLPGSKTFSLNQFLIMRDTLEVLGDIAILADILSMLSRTKQESILAAMVDTVHCNAAALSAIGALEPLQKTYGQAYIALRGARPSLLSFATALVDLCQHFPCAVTPVRALQQDLIRGDRGRALAACSPFSDGIAESLQQAGATFVDDFEAILQGEPNMSEQTMTSLFQVLVGRIMKSDNESHDQSTFALCQLLARLRLFRSSQGDLLVKKWISRLFTAAWSQVHQSIILELISTRCISVEALLSICEQAPPVSSCRIAVIELVTNSLLFQSTPAESQPQTYVVRIAARRMLVASPVRVLEMLASKGIPNSRMIGVCAIVLPGILGDKGKLSTLSASATKRLPSIIDGFLGLSSGHQEVLSRILLLSDWLSIHFCRYRLTMQQLGEGGDIYGSDLNKTGSEILNALRFRSEEQPVDVELVQTLMDAMPSEVSAQVRAMTEQHFYNTIPKSFHGRDPNQALHYIAEDRVRCMQVINRLVSLGPAKFVHATADTNGMLIERLTIIHKVLGAKGDITQGGSGGLSVSSPVSPGPSIGNLSVSVDQRQRENIMSAMEHLELISRVASMKAGSFGSQVNATNSASPKQVQTEQMKILALMASIATQPVLTQLLQSEMDSKRKKLIRECISLTLDVAARIADDLSEEARGQCAKVLKEKIRDERILWLVGSMNMNAVFQNAAGQGLAIMHESKGYMGEFRPKQWEMLESGGGKEGDTCLGLGLFGAKRL